MYLNGITHPVSSGANLKIASHSEESLNQHYFTSLQTKQQLLESNCIWFLSCLQRQSYRLQRFLLLNQHQIQHKPIQMSLNVNIQRLSSLRALDGELNKPNNDSRFRRIYRNLFLAGQGLGKLVIEIGVKRRIKGRYSLALECAIGLSAGQCTWTRSAVSKGRSIPTRNQRDTTYQIAQMIRPHIHHLQAAYQL